MIKRQTVQARRRHPDFVRGGETGLSIPSHPEALKEAGPRFLTEAFQAWGALGADNAVERLVDAVPCPGGSTGAKIFLTVEYARPHRALHEELFVKFSRDFNDPSRDDRGKFEMQGEISLARLSRLPDFPVRVPRVYFADQEQATHTGILVTERIAFGEGGLEEHHAKCLDHRIEEPVEHYRAIMKSLARLAGAQRSNRLAGEVETLFSYDPDVAATSIPIGYSASDLRERVLQFQRFVEEAPQLFPAPLREPAFFARLAEESGRFAGQEVAINAFLQSDPAFIALCHWNANIDNAFFWRGEDGPLECGLIDWGRAGRMNVAFAIWGSLSAAHHDIWEHHLDDLLLLFAKTLAREGGPRLPVSVLRLHLELYAGIMGLSYFLDCPARIRNAVPTVMTAAGIRDPVVEGHEHVRNQLHIATVVLNLWRRRGLGALLDSLSHQTAGHAGS